MNRPSVYLEITLAGETIRFSVEMTETYLHSAKGNGWADTNVRFGGKDYLVGGDM